MFGSSGELTGEGGGGWETVSSSSLDTQLLCRHSSLSFSVTLMTNDIGILNLGTEASICLFPRLPLSVTGKPWIRTNSLVCLLFSPPSDLEMADLNEGILSFIRILTAVAELLSRPHYLLISNIFFNIVFYITENKLDVIFNVA